MIFMDFNLVDVSKMTFMNFNLVCNVSRIIIMGFNLVCDASRINHEFNPNVLFKGDHKYTNYMKLVEQVLNRGTDEKLNFDR